MTPLQTDNRVHIAGYRGMARSAIHRALRFAGEQNVLTTTSKNLDVRDAAAVDEFVSANRPTQVHQGGWHPGE